MMLRHAIDSEILFRNVSIYIYIFIYVSFGHGSFLNVEGNYNRSMVPMLKHKGQNNSSKQSSVGNQKTSRMICGLRTGLILPKSITYETSSLYTSFEVHVGYFAGHFGA